MSGYVDKGSVLEEGCQVRLLISSSLFNYISFIPFCVGQINDRE
jgi:hypothetical protein